MKDTSGYKTRLFPFWLQIVKYTTSLPSMNLLHNPFSIVGQIIRCVRLKLSLSALLSFFTIKVQTGFVFLCCCHYLTMQLHKQSVFFKIGM